MNKQEAADRGCVPCPPFTRVMREWVSKQESIPDTADAVLLRPLPLLASRAKLDVRTIRHFMSGPAWISFDSADRIIGAIDPFLRLEDPEIRFIYASADLTWLDRTRPCCEASAA